MTLSFRIGIAQKAVCPVLFNAWFLLYLVSTYGCERFDSQNESCWVGVCWIQLGIFQRSNTSLKRKSIYCRSYAVFLAYYCYPTNNSRRQSWLLRLNNLNKLVVCAHNLRISLRFLRNWHLRCTAEVQVVQAQTWSVEDLGEGLTLRPVHQSKSWTWLFQRSVPDSTAGSPALCPAGHRGWGFRGGGSHRTANRELNQTSWPDSVIHRTSCFIINFRVY